MGLEQTSELLDSWTLVDDDVALMTMKSGTTRAAGSSTVSISTGSSPIMLLGKDQNRPQLEALIDFSRDGDTVLVHSMDCLARNLDDLHAIVRRLIDKKVQVRFLKENLTFTGEDTAMATFLISVMGRSPSSNEPSSENDNVRESPWLKRPASTRQAH